MGEITKFAIGRFIHGATLGSVFVNVMNIAITGDAVTGAVVALIVFATASGVWGTYRER